jgi:hypothetical protein
LQPSERILDSVLFRATPTSPEAKNIASDYTHAPVNEFYKKGCQEKTSASTGGREDFGLEIQPTVYCALDALEGFSLFCFLFLSRLDLLVVTTPIGP